MYMLSKKDLSSGELETPKGSRSSVTVLTTNGENQTTNFAESTITFVILSV